MFIITTQCPNFGRGYFIGFDRESRAHFQSGNDRSVKTYKTRHGAKRQLQRIIASSGSLAEGETFSIQKTTTAAQVCALYEESRLLETLLKCMTNVGDDTDSTDILGAVIIAANLAERLTAGINAAIETASQDLACSIYEMDMGETDMPLDDMNARLEATCKDLFKQIRQTGGC